MNFKKIIKSIIVGSSIIISVGALYASSANLTHVSSGEIKVASESEGDLFLDDLAFGSKGNSVTSLQTSLEKEGYLIMPKGVQKGYFGIVTKEALKKFQKAKGITSTGTFGPKTRLLYNTNNRIEESKKLMAQEERIKSSNQVVTKNSSTTSLHKEEATLQISTTTIVGEHPYQIQASGGNHQVGVVVTPSKEAVEACEPKQEDEACSFVVLGSASVTGICKEIQENLACIP